MRRFIGLLGIAFCTIWLLPAQQSAGGANQASQSGTSASTTATPGQSSTTPTYVMPNDQVYRFNATAAETLVNLQVTDNKGNPVMNLKPSDVTILEDGKRQAILSFALENIAQANDELTLAESGAGQAAGPQSVNLSPVAPTPASTAAAPSEAAPGDAGVYANRRLLVLYFDMTTMQPEDVVTAVQSAQNYIKQQMQPADLVAIVTLGDSLQVDQDFTSDKDALNHTLELFNPNTSAGFQQGNAGGVANGTPDDGNSFEEDDTEFNSMDVDRSLESLEQVCDMLAHIQQKKSLLYFASGLQQTGVVNEIVLRGAVNAAVKSNVSIYTVDPRGLQALPPGGSANSASIRGNSTYSGQSQLGALQSNFQQDETLSTLATDTGGRSFLDTNDFAPAYTRIQQDTRWYYMITYHSTNPLKDGKYRKIAVKVDRPDLKLNYRPGYYAASDINHMNSEDRSEQLQDELNTAFPEEAINIYATDGYIEIDPRHYFVPVTLAIPGAQIPLTGVNPKATPTVDVAGAVYDQVGNLLSHINKTIKLNERVIGASQELQTKNLQWTTGFLLAPGQSYNIRFAAREDQTGQLGAFQTMLTIPNLNSDAAKSPSLLRVSSVLTGSQLETVKPSVDDPLTATGQELIPSVTRVFSLNQTMYLYYEVYDPQVKNGHIDLKTDVAFYQGRVKVFQTQVLDTDQLTDARRNAAVVQMAIPLSALKPGYYTCQVTAIDSNAGRFAFPQFTVLLQPARTQGGSPSH